MALDDTPPTRNTTYVAGVSEVEADDLNDIQDEIIALKQAGSFTPTLVNNGVAHGTYSAQQGRFHRLGNFVFFQLRIVATSLDPAGTIVIPAASLPVPPSAASVARQAAAVSLFIGAAVPPQRAFARIDANGITLQEDVGVATDTNWSALSNGTYTIVIGGHYLAA